MSSVANKYRKGPNQCPDPAQETRELRRMVQERDEEIERLREALNRILGAVPPKPSPDNTQLVRWMGNVAFDALDGGGGDDDE